MPLTITSKDFDKLTNRKGGWRSSRMDRVLEALQAYEKNTRDKIALVNLRGALRKVWGRT
jgi:hypothetical protein